MQTLILTILGVLKDMDKKCKISIVGMVVISAIIFAVFYSNKAQLIVPFSNIDKIELGSYHEPLKDGFSIGESNFEEGRWKLKYKLGSGSLDPFIGFFIHKKNTTDSFFDFSQFNEIRLYLVAKNARRIPITYTINYKGYTTQKLELTNIPFTTVIDYNKPGWYTVKIADFGKQSWWFREQKKHEDDFPNIQLDRVNYFVVGSCQVLGQNGSDEIEVSHIELGNDNTLFVSVWALSSILIIVITFLFGRKLKEKILVPYIPQEVKVKSGSTLELITDFLAKNYSNPDLSKNDLQQELGISSRLIGSELKEGLNTSFKSYLNYIRLIEVKRLLQETDLSISEIAYKSGYNNISHFNRVFKAELKCSPKQYRETSV